VPQAKIRINAETIWQWWMQRNIEKGASNQAL
jgi:hypothetical protein